MIPVLVAAAGAVLLAGLVLALLRPQIALLLLVALDVSYINAVIASHVGVSPYLPQLALALVALGVMVRRRMFTFRWSPVLLGLAVLYAGFFISFRDAADPYTSEILLQARIRDLVFFVAVYALVLSTRQIAPVLRAAVLVLAGLAALTVFHEYVLNNAGTLGGLSTVPLVEEGGAFAARHAGTHADVNFWARLLLLFTPLSLSLFATSRTTPSRLLWIVSTLALLMGVYLTQSRGGFIALFIALVIWAVLAGARYRRALLWSLLGLVLLVPMSGIGARLATIVEFGTGSRAIADGSLVTRERLQLIAWNMFLDAPATGHGIGSYPTLFASYDRLVNYYNKVTLGAAAHNFFLEQAADGGVVLLLAWAIFLGGVFFLLLRTRKITRATGDDHSRYLAIGILAGLIGWLAASVFLHLSDYRTLLMLAALAGALDLRARDQLGALHRESAPARHLDDRLVVPGLLAVAAAALTGTVAVLGSSGDRYTSSTTLAVLPSSQQTDQVDSYALDVVSRGMIVPTLAAVLDRSVSVADLAPRSAERAASAELDIQQSRLGGAVIVTVTADDEQTAFELGEAAVTLARSEVADLDSGYRLAGSGSGPVEREPSYAWVAVAPGAVLLLAVLGAVLRLRRRTVSAP